MLTHTIIQSNEWKVVDSASFLRGRFGEERVDHLADGFLSLLPLVVEFPLPSVTNNALAVDDVNRWPDAVLPGFPVPGLVIDGDRKF